MVVRLIKKSYEAFGCYRKILFMLILIFDKSLFGALYGMSKSSPYCLVLSLSSHMIAIIF